MLHSRISSISSKIFFFILSIGYIILPYNVNAGFGVSPPLIKEGRLVPGIEISRTIYLVQGNPERGLEAEIIVESKDIKDWISFPEGKKFVIPEGIQQYPLDVIIAVPKDAPLGIYKASVRINTTAEKTKQAGEVAIALGGKVDIDLTVGDEIFADFKIKSIKILDIKENQNPQVSIAIINTGNIPISPDSASFELLNKYGTTRLAYSQNDNLPEIDAFLEEETIVEFPIDFKLAQGEYWGEVIIYNDKGTKISELRTVFNVHENTPVTKIVEGAVKDYKKYIIPISIGGATFLVFLVIFIIVRQLRKPRT